MRIGHLVCALVSRAVVAGLRRPWYHRAVWRLRLKWLTLLGMLAIGGRAHAESEAIAVLHAGTGAERAGDRQRVLSTLRADHRSATLALATPSLDQLRKHLATHRRAQHLEGARRQARVGARLLTALKLDAAIKALKASLNHYAALQPDGAACREAVGPMRDLAFARWQRGDLGLAAPLVAGANQAPPVPIDTLRYPPPFVAFLRQPHAVQPDSVTPPPLPVGAAIWSTCRQVSPTEPVSMTGAALLKITAPGFRDWAAFHPAEKKGTVVLAQLEPELPLARWDIDRLVDARRALDVKRLVLWRRDEDRLELRDVRAGQPPGRWRPLAAEAAPRIARRPGPEPDSGAADRHEPRRSTSWRKVARWTLLATGAGALVTGTVLGAMAQDATNQINQAAEEARIYDDELAELNQRRRSFGTAAYVLWGVGGAAAASALVLWLLPQRDRGATGASLAPSIGPDSCGVTVRW